MTDNSDLTDRLDIDRLTRFVRSDSLLGGVITSGGFDLNETLVAREFGFDEGGGLMVLVTRGGQSIHIVHYDEAYRLDNDQPELSYDEIVANFPEALVAVAMLQESL